MSISTKDRFPINYKGFLYRKSNDSLIINSTDFDRAIKIMKNDNIRSLEINPNFFDGQDLSFLSKFNFVKELTILSDNVKDIAPVEALSNLSILNIENKLGGSIDFRVFQDLKECSFVWGIQGCETIFEVPSLTHLRIDNYNRFEIFEIQNLNLLCSLSLYYSKIVNLIGISNLDDLVNLNLTGCSCLEDISEINKLKELNALVLDNCQNLKNFEPIGQLEKLRSLSLNDVKDLPSINFLESLYNLEEIFFTGNTEVVDGDLNVLINLCQKGKLKKIIFKNRRFYTHKVENFGFKVPTVVSNIFRKKS